MFKLAESSEYVETIAEVRLEGYEAIGPNTLIPKSHRFWKTYEAWLALGNTPEPYDNRTDAEKLEAVKQVLSQAVQKHLDATAQERSYDGILSLASYATSSNATFASEGQAGVEWRDEAWGYCYQAMSDVEAGLRSVPAAGELIAELPAMQWPTGA